MKDDNGIAAAAAFNAASGTVTPTVHFRTVHVKEQRARTIAAGLLSSPATATDRTVFVRDRSAFYKVNYACILFLRAEGNYVELHTNDRRFVIRNSLADLQAQLGDPRFAQVNRSTVVNADHVVCVTHDAVHVENEVMTLSRSFKDEFLASLHILQGR